MRISFTPVGSVLLVGLLALALIALLFLQPSRHKTTSGRRRTLVVLRGLIVGMMIFALLRPTIVFTQVKKHSAALVVMLDQSRSMLVSDGVGNQSRWSILRGAVDEAQPLLRELQEYLDVQIYAFDADPQPLELTDEPLALAEFPEGNQSAIGHALDAILKKEAGKRLAGVLLLSDGAQRAYAPRDVAPQNPAQQLAALGYPLYAFGIGQAQGLGQVRDIALEGMRAPQSVFVKNQLRVSGSVRIEGFADREVVVQLAFENPSGEMAVVDTRKIRPGRDTQQFSGRPRSCPADPGRVQADHEGRRPSRRAGHHEQSGKHICFGTQRRNQCPLCRRCQTPRTKLFASRARCLGEYQGRLLVPRST